MSRNELDITLTDANIATTNNIINCDYFSFKMIFATGAKANLNFKENDCDLITFEMLPTYIEFDGKLFFFQQILTYGKDFLIGDNEKFFFDCSYDKKNKYYVGDDYENYDKYYENSIFYFDLEYEDCNLTTEEIIEVAIDPNQIFPAIRSDNFDSDESDSDESDNDLYNDRVNKIKYILSDKEFVDQIVSLMAKNQSLVQKHQNITNEFYDDIFGFKCDITFRVVTGYIKFE